MKISLYPPLSIHEIGQRPNQEDSIAQWDNRLFVLCDGMGGHEKGEVASQTVCQSLVRWFEENIKDDSFSDDQLREAIEYAYKFIVRHLLQHAIRTHIEVVARLNVCDVDNVRTHAIILAGSHCTSDDVLL